MRAAAAIPSTFPFGQFLASKLFRLIGRDRTLRHGMGGNGITGVIPSTLPAPPRNGRPLPAYIPNRSDKSGTPPAEAGKLHIYIRRVRGLRSIAMAKQALYFPGQVRHGRM